MTSVTRGGSHIGNHSDRGGGGAYQQNYPRVSSSADPETSSRNRARSNGRGEKSAESGYRTDGQDARSQRAYEQGSRSNVTGVETSHRRPSRQLEEVSNSSASNGHSSDNYALAQSSRVRSADRDRSHYSDTVPSKRRDDGAQRQRHGSASRDDDIDRYFTLQHESKSSSKKGNSIRRSTSTDYEHADRQELSSRRTKDSDHDHRDRRRSSSQTRNPEWADDAYSDHSRSSRHEYDYKEETSSRRTSEISMSFRDAQGHKERHRSNTGQKNGSDVLYYHDDGSRTSVGRSSSRQSLGSDNERHHSRQKGNGSNVSARHDRETPQGHETVGRRHSNARSSDYCTLTKSSAAAKVPAEPSATVDAKSFNKSSQRQEVPARNEAVGRAVKDKTDDRLKEDKGQRKSLQPAQHQRANEENETLSAGHHVSGSTSRSPASSRANQNPLLAAASPSASRRDDPHSRLNAHATHTTRNPEDDFARSHSDEVSKNRRQSQVPSNVEGLNSAQHPKDHHLASNIKGDSSLKDSSHSEMSHSKGNLKSLDNQIKTPTSVSKDSSNKPTGFKSNPSLNDDTSTSSAVKGKNSITPDSNIPRSAQELSRAQPKAESASPRANSSTSSYFTGSISSLLARATGGQSAAHQSTGNSVSERWRSLKEGIISDADSPNNTGSATAIFSAAAAKFMNSLPNSIVKNIPLHTNAPPTPASTASPTAAQARLKTQSHNRIPDFSTAAKKDEVFSIPRSKTEERNQLSSAKHEMSLTSTALSGDKSLSGEKQNRGDKQPGIEKPANYQKQTSVERQDSCDSQRTPDKLSNHDRKRSSGNDKLLSSEKSSPCDKQLSSDQRSNGDRKLSSEKVSNADKLSNVELASRSPRDGRRSDVNRDIVFATRNGVNNAKVGNPRPSVVSATLSNTRSNGYTKQPVTEKLDSPQTDDSGQMTPQDQGADMKRRSKDIDGELTSFLPAEMSRREEKFHDAARMNDSALIRALLKEKVNVNCKNSLDRTALHWAAANGNLDAVEALIEGGADLEAKDKYGMRSILWSAWFGHIPVLKALVNAGANTRVTNKQGLGVLHCAAENNHMPVIGFIFDALDPHDVNKRDLNERTPLHSAAEGGHFESVSRLLEAKADLHKKDKAGMTAVHLAAKSGHIDVLKVLLMQGVEVDDRDIEGKTALHLAAEAGHKDAVDLLLDYTANPNSETVKEFTPLHLAAMEGYTEMCRSLIKYGCNTNAQNYQGNTALFLAANGNHKEVARVLVDAKCEIDLPNSRMQTPLHVAVECGHLEVVQVLLAGGASLDAREKSGKSALQLAARSNHVAVVDMLIKAERYFANTREYHDKDVGYLDPDTYLRKAQHPHASQMKDVLWKLATKQLKPNDWKKLAYHWHFTADHVKAIEQEYTGATSYKDHGFRLLNIWLHGIRKDENVLKLLFEALVAIDRKQLAENIRKKVNLLAEKPCSPTLCSVS